jgi:aromatic-L-amino-acid decarboxylase
MPEDTSPLEMSPEEFRTLGHHLVDVIAEYLYSLATRKRTTATRWTPEAIRARLPQGGLPEGGADPKAIIDEAAELVFDGYRRNGHPGYWGYIMGCPAPIGILGEMLAAAANANLASWHSAQVPNEIEAQSVRWLAEFLGYPTDCGGLLTSGGNMANFIGVLAARRAHAAPDMQARGLAGSNTALRLYTSRETHTWVEKAADLFGLGTDAIRWIDTDGAQRIDMTALEARIAADKAAGEQPFLVVGSAGTVSTGAVDPLPEIAALCRRHGLWFHVDGAYGAPAAASALTPAALKGLAQADSLAVDAHKWLCVPIEAGCALVRDRANLRATFAHHPPYYFYPDVGGDVVHYHEHGPQNSRAFRALKLWLTLRHVGRTAYVEMIAPSIWRARCTGSSMSPLSSRPRPRASASRPSVTCPPTSTARWTARRITLTTSTGRWSSASRAASRSSSPMP